MLSVYFLNGKKITESFCLMPVNGSPCALRHLISLLYPKGNGRHLGLALSAK